jgi:uncharacterized protein YbjT (DUF2867 family)
MNSSTSNIRVVLTGTTGGLGSATLKHILAQKIIPPSNLIISLYNPSKAPALTEGLEIRRGDYTNPETLHIAYKGANILFLVSYPSIAHKLRVDSHKNAIDAAKSVGITHVIYTSLAFGGDLQDSSVAAVMRAHLDTEAYLKASGLNYTIIREGIYSESYPLYLGFFDPSSGQNEVCIPEDGNGGIAWASRDELGEATARIIARAYNGDVTSSLSINNTSILLSGPEAISLSNLASLISNLLARAEPIRVRYVSVDAYATSSAALSRLGPEFARLWATTYEALKQGECAVVTPALEELLGRRPREIKSVLEELLKDVGAAQGTIDQYAK